VYLIAADLLTEPERHVVQQLDIRHEPIAVVRTDLDAVLDRLLTWASVFDRILIHIDIDVLHYPDFPIAHEIREVPGLTIDELHLLASRVRQIPQWAGLTLCEVNPDHATDVAGQFTRLVSLPSRRRLGLQPLAHRVYRRTTKDPRRSGSMLTRVSCTCRS
jgi:arginase family enzyme